MPEKPEYFDLHRCLCMLRRLQLGPARRDELMAQVRAELGVEVYPEEANLARKRFERDRQRLRDWGCAIELEDGNYYRLLSYGAFSPVSLPGEALDGLAFLQETFAPGAPQAEAVQALLQRV